MIPALHAPILFGLVLTRPMSFVVSGIATLRAAGLSEGAVALWMGSWASSWAEAFPTVLVVGPPTRRVVARPTRPDPPAAASQGKRPGVGERRP